MIEQVSQINPYGLLIPLNKISTNSLSPGIKKSSGVYLIRSNNSETESQELLMLLSVSREGINENWLQEYIRLSGNEFRNVNTLIENLINNGIIEKRKSRYIFRDSNDMRKIYNQIGNRNKNFLHNAYAYAIERSNRIIKKEDFPEIAFHFCKANNLKKSEYYLEKAADYLKENFKNSGAIKNYRQCIELLNENDKEKKLDLMIKILEIMYTTGKWNEINEYYKEANKLSKEIGDKSSRAKIFNLYGSVCFFRGEVAEAIKSFRKSEDLMLYNINNEVYAETMRFLGRSYLRQGKNDKAEMYFNKTLKIGEKLGNDELKAKALENLGRIYRLKSEYGKAMEYYKKALPLFKIRKDLNGVSNILEKLGVVSFYLENDDQALGYFRSSNRINSTTGNMIGICNNLGNIGSIYLRQKNLRKAESYYGKQLSFAEEINNLEINARAIGYLGLINEEKGNLNRSLDFYQKQLKLYRRLNNSHGISNALSNISLVYSYLGELGKAIDISKRQILLDEKISHIEGITRGYNNLGTYYLNSEKYNEALKCFNKALKICNKNNLNSFKEGVYYNLSESYYYLKKYEKALKVIEFVKKLKLNQYKGYFDISYLKIKCCMSENLISHLEKIEDLLKSVSDKLLLAEIYFSLCELILLFKLDRSLYNDYFENAKYLLSIIYKECKKFQIKKKFLIIS